jgi:hypothetical protein
MSHINPGATQHNNATDLEELKDAISSLGAVILKLQSQSGKTSDDAETIEELQRRYSVLRAEFEDLENSGATRQQRGDERSSSDPNDTFDQIKSTARASWDSTREKVSTAYSDLRDYATDEKNTRAFKQSADDVGKGFADAWNSLAGSFERAYQRFSTDDEQGEKDRQVNSRANDQ